MEDDDNKPITFDDDEETQERMSWKDIVALLIAGYQVFLPLVIVIIVAFLISAFFITKVLLR